MRLKLIIIALLFPFIAANAQIEPIKMVISDGMSDFTLKQTIENNISQFLTECNKAVINGKKPNISKYLTSNGRDELNKIWISSPVSCTVNKIEEICLKTANGYQIRNIPVYIVGAKEPEKRQEVVLDLTPAGAIDGMSFSIEANMYKEIMNEHESVEDLFRRQVIVDFVENYRTAYNRKDIKYIESVFSDNALIITGHVIKEKPKSDGMLLSLGKEKIVYQKQEKKDYIAKLEKVFGKNEYLNVMFDEVDVIQHPKLTDIYGVTLKQRWKSSTYSDVGFIFLMIDFHDELNPLIQVRTWQPEKLNEKVLERNEVFNLGDFDIVRSVSKS